MNNYHKLTRLLLRTVIIGVLMISMVVPAFASSTPQLIKDINTDGQGTDFFDDGGAPITINGVAYYTLSSPLYGDELWKSDGTEQGTVMVKDIYPGAVDSEPYGFRVFNNKLIFIANHPDYGEELWISDGTEEGTQLLKDTTPGEEDGDIDSTMVVMGGELYFTADNENEYEVLWKTDGTTSGTVIVGDPGVTFSATDYYLELIDANTTTVFVLMYDYGNNSTTYLVTYDGALSIVTDSDLEPVTNVYSDGNKSGATVNENLIFTRCASEGCEPWIYDNTLGTASILLDITGNSSDSYPRDFRAIGNTAVLFIACQEQNFNNCEVWTTDGTSVGTAQLADINEGSDSSFPNIIFVSTTKAYFSGQNNSGLEELWVTDGTIEGTSKVYELSEYESDNGIEDDEGEALIAGGKLYFQMCAGESYDCELYTTNLDDTGVILVRDIWEGDDDSDPEHFVEIDGGIVLFGAENQEYGFELWRTDGTESGTTLVKDITTSTVGSFGEYPVAFGDTVIFNAYTDTYGTEVWISDGTEEGTVLVKDIVPGPNDSYPYDFYSYNGKVYFTAETDNEGRELWVTDGTESGTQLVKDIYPGSGTSNINSFTGMGDYVYFGAYASDNQGALWRTDGTEEGTTLIKTLDPNNGYIEEIIVSGDNLFFRGFTSDVNYELWTSDGTEEGTVLVKDIYEGNDGGYPSEIYAHSDGTIYFTARTFDEGYELWKSDGTEEGTVLVKDIYEGTSDAYPGDFTQLGDHIYFYVQSSEYGNELWKTDGTEEGTVLVKDIYPGESSSSPYYITRLGDHIYFEAETEEDGDELWKSDGTEEGTVLVKDIYPGSESSDLEQLTAVGDRLYFVAISQEDDDNNEDVELWISDGTESGTERVADIYPGFQGSFPEGITVFQDNLFFFAESLEYGDEPYIITNLDISEEIPGCTNSQASNYNAQATTDDGSCITSQARRRSSGGIASPALLANLGITLNTSVSSDSSADKPELCPADQILTQNLRSGARDGRFHPYTKAIVTQAKILQAHLNRLGFNSGPVDGILGPISDGAIKRMQTFLGTQPDGFVGPITRGLLNNSCGSVGLQKNQ